MSIHVVNEAKRCLRCKSPPCMKGCPIGTDISLMIGDFLDGKVEECGERLFENNPLSLICSLICNHENQCEGHCVLNKKGYPVHISSIEHYISDNYFDRLKLKMQPPNGIKTAVIGSGPAGITIAILLAQKGYDVTIFESKDKIGGVLRYGIPDFRLPKTILERYRKKLIEFGIKIRPNTGIGSVIDIDQMFRDGYKAISIGTGVWKPNVLNIKGETLGHVHYCINYLNNPDVYELGNKVAVIGAGNAAMDVARTAIRHGSHNVTVYARSNTISASKREAEYAKIDGVKFEYLKSPVEITDQGVIFADVEIAEDGVTKTISKKSSLYEADSVIVSVGQGPRNRIVSTTEGINVNPRGLVLTDKQGGTTRKGVFASGDVVSGARTVVDTVRHSKEVAEAMDEYLKSLPD